MIEERRQGKIVCFGKEITVTKVTKPWVRVPVKMGFFPDIQQYVSNDQAYGKLSGNRNWIKNVKICQISP
jgi:hypothetical protein